MQQKISFNQERDFSSVLGDSIKFIKQNFKPLFGSILLLVGPFILVMSIVNSYMQNSVRNNMFSNPGDVWAMFNSNYFLSIGVMFFFSFLIQTLLNSITYNYMCLYHEKNSDEKITVSEVSKKVLSNIGLMLGSVSAMFVLTVILIIVLALIAIGISSVGGIGGGILVGLSIFFGSAIYMPVLFFLVSAGFYVVIRDGVFIFPAMGKVRKYLSGNFWWTWLIMVVAIICIYILFILFSLPTSIISMIDVFSRAKNVTTFEGDASPSILMMALYTITMLLTTCTGSILNLISAFNFLSHEEKHEGKGLQSRIEEITL